MPIDFRERGRERKERWGEREKHQHERNIDVLLPVRALTGGRTCNILVYRTMLQPPEPPGQGDTSFLSPFLSLWYISVKNSELERLRPVLLLSSMNDEETREKAVFPLAGSHQLFLAMVSTYQVPGALLPT